jgi:hypothetical protein
MPAPTTGLGTHILDLSDERLAAGRTLRFTMFGRSETPGKAATSPSRSRPDGGHGSQRAGTNEMGAQIHV